MSKALVTGGYGFIGSNFVRLLTSRGYRVYVVDNMSYGSHPDNLEGLDVRFTKTDIRDKDLVEKIVEEFSPDYIFNFAAESHVDRSISNPLPFESTNFMGTASMLEAFRGLGRGTFIQIGTDEEYGEIMSGSFKETDSLKPSSPYSASKAGASLLALSYARTYGLDVRVTRLSNNYGPHQFPEKLIPKAIVRAMLNLPVPIYGSGMGIRDWIYVADSCEAILTVAERGKPREIYNISARNEMRNIDVMKKILDIMGKPGLIKFVDERPGHDFRYSIDPSKVMSLGWSPRTPFEKGLEITVKWYIENRWWWEKVINERVLSETPWKM